MKRYWAQYLLIALAVIVVFGQTLCFDFVRWDDENLILRNPYVAQFSRASLTHAWEAPYRLLYVPLTYNVWSLLAVLGSDSHGPVPEPAFFHAANVLLHLGSGILVFAILNLCFKRAWPAAAGALIWAIHPLQVEPVAWATGMKDVLSGFLAIAAILVHLVAVERPARAVPLRLAAFVLLLMASFAKPGVVAVPVIALAIEWLLLAQPLRLAAVHAVSLVAAVIPAAVITQVVQSTAGTVDAPLLARPLIAGHALTTYLLKLLWPASLGIDYGLRPDRVMAGQWWRFAWVIPVALTVAILLLGNARRRVMGAAWLIFFAGVAPVLGLLPFVFQYYSTVADRYVYLSMLGVAAAVAWAMIRIPARIAVVAGLCVIFALVIRSVVQASVWEDSRSLLEHAMVVNPASFVAPNNIAKILMDDATTIRQNVADQDPKDPRVSQQLAVADRADAEAERLVRISLQNLPTYSHALNNLAVYQLRRGEMDAAFETLQKAVDEWDRFSPEVTRDAVDRLTLAQAAINLGRYAQAVDNLQKFLQRNPGNEQAQSLLREASAKLSAALASQPATGASTAPSQSPSPSPEAR